MRRNSATAAEIFWRPAVLVQTTNLWILYLFAQTHTQTLIFAFRPHLCHANPIKTTLKGLIGPCSKRHLPVGTVLTSTETMTAYTSQCIDDVTVCKTINSRAK